jgi:hypothetical protein
MASQTDAALWSQHSFVSVAGGYWTGSSAVTDLLAEHEDTVVVPGEYMLFSYGQFFQEVTHPLIAGRSAGSHLGAHLHRMREFNRPERLPLLRAAARRALSAVRLYPHLFFSRRRGMGRFLGTDYLEACARLERALVRGVERPGPELRSTIEGLLLSVLESSGAGVAGERLGGWHVCVFDQMVGPPYIEHAREVLPQLKYINVDRDWRDQYISLRQHHRRMTGVNQALGVRPWDEAADDLETDLATYFVQLRCRMHEVRVRQVAAADQHVLWLDFEDIVASPQNAANRIFRFLGLSGDRWAPNTRFLPSVSQRRIGKWTQPQWSSGRGREELSALAARLINVGCLPEPKPSPLR